MLSAVSKCERGILDDGDFNASEYPLWIKPATDKLPSRKVAGSIPDGVIGIFH
jgi:hypothetical protein